MDTFVWGHCKGSARQAGFAATKAEAAKCQKYHDLQSNYHFQSVAIETTGVPLTWVASRRKLLMCLVTPLCANGSTSSCPWLWPEKTLPTYWPVCKFDLILSACSVLTSIVAHHPVSIYGSVVPHWDAICNTQGCRKLTRISIYHCKDIFKMSPNLILKCYGFATGCSKPQKVGNHWSSYCLLNPHSFCKLHCPLCCAVLLCALVQCCVMFHIAWKLCIRSFNIKNVQFFDTWHTV